MWSWGSHVWSNNSHGVEVSLLLLSPVKSSNDHRRVFLASMNSLSASIKEAILLSRSNQTVHPIWLLSSIWSGRITICGLIYQSIKSVFLHPSSKWTENCIDYLRQHLKRSSPGLTECIYTSNSIKHRENLIWFAPPQIERQLKVSFVEKFNAATFVTKCISS